MACKYKYNNNWYSKEELQSILYKERGIDKYGKLVKPEIKEKNNREKWAAIDTGDRKSIREFETKEEAEQWINENYKEAEELGLNLELGKVKQVGIQPTQTLKESIESVKNKLEPKTDTRLTENAITDISKVPLEFESKTKDDKDALIRFENNKWLAVADGTYVTQELSELQVIKAYNKVLGNTYKKEYTEQALINTKIAKLKEVAKKYPKSLIRSEVKLINTSSSQELYDQFDPDEMPFQKISSLLPSNGRVNQSLQEGLQWLHQIMPNVEPKLVDGLINNIANGSYDILEDLITLSKDFANKNVVKEEVFHKIFNLLPKEEQEKLLDEGSRKYGIERGESKATIKYSLADQNKINFGLKSVEILQSDKAKQIFDKGEKNKWDLNKILNELQIPKEQKQLILDLGKTDREEIITDLLANYSYTIEINTAKEIDISKTQDNNFSVNNNNYELKYKSEIGNTYFKNNKQITEDEFIQANNDYVKSKPTQHYSNLTVPGGTNYTENEIATPAITPSIKGHAQFATDKGIGWFRSDDKAIITDTTALEDEDKYYSEAEGGWVYTNQIKEPTKTRRILEVQSDLFQKGRDKENLISKKGRYYRVVNANIGEDVIFEPKSYSEAFEQNEDGKWYPKYNKYGGYWKSTIPEISASKNIGSAVMGNWTASGMPKEGAFFIYELEEGLEPDYDISHLEIGDFKQLQEVRYRKPVKGKLIGEFKITPDIHNIFSENYDLMSEDGGINKHYELEDSFEKKYGYRPYDDNAPESAIETFNKVQDEYWKNQSLKVEKALQNIHNKYDEQVRQNQFLQLLNKDNNWVTFFIKAVLQDSIKKGYEKILFPSGNTASKVEGHTTLEEFKKQKEDRIKELEVDIKYTPETLKVGDTITQTNPFGGTTEVVVENEQHLKSILSFYGPNIREINQLKQELERVETEGFGALKPIWNFYENTVTNILNKTYGKENVKQITDEYGNTWNEITLTPKMSETIRLNTPKGKIEYVGDLAIEEKIAEEAYNSKDEKVPSTLIGKFIQSLRNLLRNLFKERDNISRLIRNLNQGRIIPSNGKVIDNPVKPIKLTKTSFKYISNPEINPYKFTPDKGGYSDVVSRLKSRLITLRITDKNMVIKDPNMFSRLQESWTNQAEKLYNLVSIPKVMIEDNGKVKFRDYLFNEIDYKNGVITESNKSSGDRIKLEEAGLSQQNINHFFNNYFNESHTYSDGSSSESVNKEFSVSSYIEFINKRQRTNLDANSFNTIGEYINELNRLALEPNDISIGLLSSEEIDKRACKR